MTDKRYNLNILLDILKTKRHFLLQILNLTENQEAILFISEKEGNAEMPELSMMFNEMNNEKQKLIDQVINTDNIFQSTFDQMAEWFNEHAEMLKPQIKELQEKIKEVVDIDVKIRVQEQKNKELVERLRPKQKINTAMAKRGYLLKKYESNNIRSEKSKNILTQGQGENLTSED